MTNENQNPKAAATNPSTAGATQNNETKQMSQQEKASMLDAEIKKAWNKLSDEEVKLQTTQPDKFFALLKEKHGIEKDEAQKRLAAIKATCGACTSEKAA